MSKRNEAEEINFRMFAGHKKGIDVVAVVKDVFDPSGIALITREQVDASNWLIKEAKKNKKEITFKEASQIIYSCNIENTKEAEKTHFNFSEF